MATDGTVPTFGLWYDFRQKPSLGDYARLYAECLEESERRPLRDAVMKA